MVNIAGFKKKKKKDPEFERISKSQDLKGPRSEVHKDATITKGDDPKSKTLVTPPNIIEKGGLAGIDEAGILKLAAHGLLSQQQEARALGGAKPPAETQEQKVAARQKQLQEESFFETVQRGAPKSIGGGSDASLIGDVALLASGGIGGTPGIQGLGGVVQSGVGQLTGKAIGASGQAATQAGTQGLKFLPKTKRAIAKDLLKAGAKRGGSAADDSLNRELAAGELAKVLSTPTRKITQRDAIRAINSYNKWSTEETTKFLVTKPVLKRVAQGAAVVSSADILTTWYAADNVLDGLRFVIPDVQEGVANGTMTNEEAIVMLENASRNAGRAATKVRWSARLNPALWPSAKLLVEGAEIKQLAFELKKDNALASLGA